MAKNPNDYTSFHFRISGLSVHLVYRLDEMLNSNLREVSTSDWTALAIYFIAKGFFVGPLLILTSVKAKT